MLHDKIVILLWPIKIHQFHFHICNKYEIKFGKENRCIYNLLQTVKEKNKNISFYF